MQCPSCSFQNQESVRFCGNCGHRLASDDKTTDSSDFISSSPEFVGRQSELSGLISLLDDALEGRGQITMLTGEPGIGKTRLAQELASIAQIRGASVLWGRCYEDQGAPPYWPWIQALRSYIIAVDAEQLHAEMGDGASDIAEAIPDVRQKLPDLSPPTTLEPEQARFRLFNSIAIFLKNSSRSHPLMLVLDDIQWADTSSLKLLEFVASEVAHSRLMVLGIYRSQEITRRHPLSQSLGLLVREQHFRTVELKGLNLHEVSLLAEATIGKSLDERLLQTLYDRTEGNPLFVREMVKLLDEASAENRQEWDIGISTGIRDVIGRRLDGVSENCNRVLTIASVIGREFEFSLLDKLLEDISQNQLLDMIDEALSARAIEELPSSLGRYQFSHALIQETLSSELSLTRRTRLHAQIAEKLEEIYGDKSEMHAAELAHHFALAETVLGTEKLVRYSKAAGEQAIASYAYEEALSQFQRALSAKGSSTSSAEEEQSIDSETAGILFGLGRAQLATFTRSQAQEAVDTFRQAFDAFVSLEDTDNAVAVATHPHGFLRFSIGTADMVARALALVSSDSLEAGYLLSRYGAALSEENNDYEGAQKNLDRAVEIARQKGDRVLEVRALAVIARMNYDQGNLDEAVDRFIPVIQLAQSLGDLDTLVVARVMCANALLSIGNGDESQKHATAGLSEAERLHNNSSLVVMLRHNAYLAALKGDWELAQEFIARALAESPWDVAALSDNALIKLQTGNLDQSSEYLKQVLDVIPDGLISAGQANAAVTIPLSARVTGKTELWDAAETIVDDVLSTPSLPNFFISRARAGLALIAIHKADVEAAKAAYSYLKPQRGTQLFAIISYDRLLALLSQTIGSLHDAQTHFEDALAFCRKSGYITELAWTLYDYAEFRQTQGDPDKALVLLNESLAISTKLGMHPLIERANALKDEAESSREQLPTVPTNPSGLTEREIEVLLLIAQGKTTREIGYELVISPRTVQRHTTNLYSKINARNRAEATAFVLNEPTISARLSLD